MNSIINITTGLETPTLEKAQAEGATHVLTVWDNGQRIELCGKRSHVVKHYNTIKDKYKHLEPVTINRRRSEASAPMLF